MFLQSKNPGSFSKTSGISVCFRKSSRYLLNTAFEVALDCCSLHFKA